MDIKTQIIRYKDYFIYGGLGIGALEFLGMLPQEFIFEENTKYLYTGIIALGIFAYYYSMGSGVKYRRTVPSRDISNPKYRDQLRQQMGTHMEKNKPTIQDTPPQQNTNTDTKKPGNKTFENYLKD